MNRRRILLAAAIVACLSAILAATVWRSDAPPRVQPSPSQASQPPASGSQTKPPGRPLPQTHGALGISDNLGHLPQKVLNARLKIMKQAGVKWLRKDIEWRGAEPAPGQYNWSTNDATVAAARRFGIEPMLILGYAPDWAAGAGQSDCRIVRCSPAHTAKTIKAFAAFASAAAKHYCAAPYRVRTYEIWNEPNLHKYWPNPNPRQYVAFLQAAYRAIKAAKCDATVVLGSTGDSACTPCLSSPDFLQGVYDAGGRKFFDHVGSHPYVQGAPQPENWRPVRLYEIMARHGDGRKQVWATEFAYSSDLGAELQALYFTAAVTVFRSYEWSGPLFWFSLQDSQNGEPFGLMDRSGRAKPALETLNDLARRQ